MAEFPTYARILLSGFTEEADFGVLRSDMDGGIAKQRPRWTTPIVSRDVTIHVETLADKNSFDQWFRMDIGGGAGWFTWLDPLDGVTKNARIKGGKLPWKSPGKVWRAETQIETVG